MKINNRCPWCNLKNQKYIDYHDNEWGKRTPDEHCLFESLMLETFQAGLSWECVLNKRDAFRQALDGFDIDKIVAYDEIKIDELMRNPGIIKNKLKLKSLIINAGVYKKIVTEYGSFASYLSSFGTDTTIYEYDKTTNRLSDALSEDLRKRGMKFMGSTTVYAYLQAIGVINSHFPSCYLYHNDKADI